MEITNKPGENGDTLFLFLLIIIDCFSRSKLQAFIITSNSYRVQSVLSRVNQTNRLRREVALLYGKVRSGSNDELI